MYEVLELLHYNINKSCWYKTLQNVTITITNDKIKYNIFEMLAKGFFQIFHQFTGYMTNKENNKRNCDKTANRNCKVEIL